MAGPAPGPNRIRTKHWVFTINAREGSNLCAAPLWDPEKMDYLVFVHQIAPTTGTHHWQGYIECKKKIDITPLKRMLCPSDPGLPAVFKRRGTQEEAIAYIKDDEKKTNVGDVYEFGEPTKISQGHRSDLENVVGMVREGKSDREILDAYPSTFARNYQAIQVVRETLAEPTSLVDVSEGHRVIVIYGPSGIGKTYQTRLMNPDAYVTDKGEKEHPFDQYKGQKTIVLDEFMHDEWKHKTLNTLMDMHYSHAFPARYHDHWNVAKKLIILTNDNPALWYSVAGTGLAPELLATIRRRIRGNCFECKTREDVLIALGDDAAAKEAIMINIP